MKHFFLSTALTTAIAFALPLAATAQEVTIKMGHAASSKHIFQTGLEMFAAKVAEKTNGNVAVEVYGDRQLGDDKQLLEGLQIGLINGALVSAPTLPLVLGASGFDALQMPFVVSSYGQLSEVLTSDLGDELLATLDDKSIKGVGFVEAGQRHFLSAGDPVTETAKFAGLKTRIVPIPLHKAIWEAIGVNPVGMAYGEVYSALETGTIDAVEINLSSIQSESLYDAADQVTLTGQYFWPGVIMLSGATWDSLSDADKAAVAEAGRETTTEAYALAAEQEADTIAFLKDQGVTINELSDLDVMQARTASVVDDWVEKDPMVARFVDAFRAGN
ncbi:TRAP transporter substrate-binding protein [Pseudooceanicola sediminis]|uniref:TRAP transporter substrate-binding protein n=1 Tax=Pseudooceanicola sediminis TaxID=2211117 RepID=A0A399J2I2_9RHOB|nr:TRAP transporter substrate-binding protein [Pseudooceanicola sediminis]KAA2317289.1 TRAP transporter substrate-binding protein [Puniceibacterium sp. HSS470]RII39643.1 TRAP transporter substrate-binding protein [Pseudooceanicola sediminis]|tara:strand:- start:20475 stop:21467 length:993 start_codon:yes stop_codon:yes gene_type:complete